MRIGRQITGTGAADVTDRLLPDSTQLSLQHYAKALDVLGASSRPGMMRLNAPGSGYQQLLRGPAEDLPFIARASGARSARARPGRRCRKGAKYNSGRQKARPRLPGSALRRLMCQR